MYKVFVDHRPIIFLRKEELKSNTKFIDASTIQSLSKDVFPILELYTISDPLYIVCYDVVGVTKRLFEDYLFIEAAGGLVQRGKDYLVIERNGLWDIPKGKIEAEESRSNSAVREVEEECGISSPRLLNELCTTQHIYEMHGNKCFKTTFWYLMEYEGNEELRPQLEEGITSVQWVSREKLLSIREKTFGSINEVLDAFQLLHSDL